MPVLYDMAGDVSCAFSLSRINKYVKGCQTGEETREPSPCPRKCHSEIAEQSWESHGTAFHRVLWVKNVFYDVH